MTYRQCACYAHVVRCTVDQILSLVQEVPRINIYQGCVSLKESQLALSNLVIVRKIHTMSCWMALKSYWRLRSATAETPVKLQSHLKILKTNLATSRLDEI